MRRLFRSIRWRLLLWQGVLMFFLITVLGLLAHRLASTDRLLRIDTEISDFERHFYRSLFEPAPGEQKPPPTPDEIRAKLKSLTPEVAALFPKAPGSHYLAVWDEDGSPLFISPNAPPWLTPPSPDKNAAPVMVNHGSHRERHRAGPVGFRATAGRDISADLGDLRRFGILLALGGGALWFTGIAGGWWLAGRALRPIDTIGRTASRIAAGNLAERIELTGEGDNELSRLGRVLNDTFDRLASAIEQRKRFTADASHELRTPVTIILSETSRGLRRDRTPEEHRAILTHCRTAATRMRSLVESLLVLAAQDSPSLAQRHTACDLADIVQGVADLLRPLAESRNTTLTLELAPSPVTGDPEALGMAAQNLLTNAILHPPPGGKVTLRTGIRGDSASLEVTDRGPGIPADHLPHIFERFHRADPARTSESGHSGLGLAIARSIVVNHHGSLTAENLTAGGALFRLELPARRDSSPLKSPPVS